MGKQAIVSGQMIVRRAENAIEAKQTAIQNVLMRHDEYLTFQDALTGYKLADLVTYTE